MHALARSAARAGVTPNAISLAGMGAGIAAGVLLGSTALLEVGSVAERALWLGGAACIQFRLLCNLIDGMVAVEGGRRTSTGELFNEAPDRVSDAATLFGAGYAAGSPMLGAVAACLAVFVAYVRALGKGLGAGSDYRGPMAKQQRMMVVTLACVALGVLPVGWRSVPSGVGWMEGALWVVVLGCVVTAARRLVRISAFLRSRA